MIVRTRGANFEVRAAGTFGPGWIVPPRFSGWQSPTTVNPGTVFGLPAAMQAIRQPSVLIASLELAIYTGRGSDRRRRDDTWQFELFSRPDGGVGEFSAFDWRSDMASALEGFGNAFAQKIRGKGRLAGQVIALEPIHPDYVWVRTQDGQKTFTIRRQGHTVEGLTSQDILHIRDFVAGGDIAAPSPVAVHRGSLGVAIALEEFQGRFFANNAKPGAVMSFPREVREVEARGWLEMWNAQHQGVQNAGKMGVIGGGAEITVLPISLEDAQFIASQEFSVEQIARIFNWPAWALDHAEQKIRITAEDQSRNLLTFYLRPRLERIQEALKKDPDLFPSRDIYPEFQTEALISVDAATQAAVDHDNIQSGLRLVDEIRADHGWAPLPGGVGAIPQVTPVGGAPNPNPLPSPPGGPGDGEPRVLRLLAERSGD